MTFFLGLVEGAAKAVDTQLRKDMDRTQERIDGMAQYRITRRRTELERKEKDKKELRDVLDSLAAFTDGDQDKAIQLYNSAGKTIAGGKDLAAELLANRKAGKDVGASITFAEAGAEPGNFTDFIKRNVTPVSVLPTMEGEMKASGLAGMFGRDIRKEVMQQVGEAAPIPEVEMPKGEGRTAVAKIDRSGFLAAEEAAEVKKERQRTEEKYGLEISGMELAQERTQQSMDLAEKAEKRAERLESENADQRDIDNARAIAADMRAEANLALARQRAYRESKASITSQELAGLKIEEKRLAIEKAKNAPQFATYEAMLVANDQKVAKLSAISEAERTPEQNRDLTEASAIVEHALEGIRKSAAAESTESYTPSFSKQSIDSIINNSIKRQLEPVGLITDIEGRIEYNIGGNEIQYFDRMSTALDNVELRIGGINDAQMDNALKGERDSLAKDVAKYINARQDIAVPQASKQAIIDGANKGEYAPGSILSYQVNNQTKFALFTGGQLIF